MAGAALALLVPLSHPALLREAAAKEENRALNELPAVPADVLAREQALAKANPHELALAEAKVAYAEYLIKGELASGELALASASPELIRKRITQIEPWAEYVVDRWATTVDTDAVRLEGPPTKFECGSQYGCPYTTTCDEKMPGAVCYVHECGRGKCSSCPDWANLGNLVFQNWCAYTCKIGDKVVGGAFIFVTTAFKVQVSVCQASK